MRPDFDVVVSVLEKLIADKRLHIPKPESRKRPAATDSEEPALNSEPPTKRAKTTLPICTSSV